MKKTMRPLLFLILGIPFLILSAADEKPKSVFLIGNSLTWDTRPPLLDGDVQWHVDCGKSLPYIFEHPEKPCVKDSTLWPKALKEKQYDFVSVQCHNGSTLTEDAAVISHFVEMQPKAVFIIHTGWAASAIMETEFAEKGAITNMNHSVDYFDALLKMLRKNHPKTEFRRTRAMDLLAVMAKDIKAGKAPFEKLSDVYRDVIHMGLQSGRYLMHNAMRKALDQPFSSAGFEKIDPKVKAYFDGLLKTLD